MKLLKAPFLFIIFITLFNCSFAENPGVVKNDRKIINIKQTDIIRTLDNVPEILDSITVSPHFTNGECIGLEVSDLGSLDIAKKMQIKNGDIIKSLDGVPLNDITEIFSYYADKDISEVKPGRKFILVLIRANQEQILNYQIIASPKKA